MAASDKEAAKRPEKVAEYEYIKMYIKYCLSGDEQLARDVIQHARDTNAPADTVMWREDPTLDKLVWVTRRELMDQSPLFIETMEDLETRDL